MGRSWASTTFACTGCSIGQSSETIPSRHRPWIGADWGIRQRTSRSRQCLESRAEVDSTGGERRVIDTGSTIHRVDADDRIRASLGGRTTMTRIDDSPRRRRSSRPSWIRRLSRASKALPSTITESIAGVRIAVSRHHRLDARSSWSGRMKMDRSSNRASTLRGVFRRWFDFPSSPWSVAGASAVALGRLDTRFHGPGRHRRPIHAMLGADRPRASCSFRRR